MKVKRIDEKNAEISSDHQDLTMGEIQDFCGFINYNKSGADHGVHTPNRQAAHDQL